MKELLEIIAKSLVDEPQNVVVEESEIDQGILLKLKVAPCDMGKVIGRQGKRAKALRTIMKAVSFRNNTNITLEIMD